MAKTASNTDSNVAWLADQLKILKKYGTAYVYSTARERDIESEMDLIGYEWCKTTVYSDGINKYNRKVKIKEYVFYERTK